jgi:hypothetical protein
MGIVSSLLAISVKRKAENVKQKLKFKDKTKGESFDF